MGHDFGGACISYAMELFPHKVSKAIYVAAAMLTNGQSTLDMFSQKVCPLKVHYTIKKFRNPSTLDMFKYLCFSHHLFRTLFFISSLGHPAHSKKCFRLHSIPMFFFFFFPPCFGVKIRSIWHYEPFCQSIFGQSVSDIAWFVSPLLKAIFSF